MPVFRRLKKYLLRLLSTALGTMNSEKTCVAFRDALNMVYPRRPISGDDLARLESRWELKATEKWSSRGRETLRSTDGSVLLPVSDGVCAVVTVVREWQGDEQQKALRRLEARLNELRVFDDEEDEPADVASFNPDPRA